MGQRVGPESDIYSVGVLVYEMLAGRPPFVDQLASAVLIKQTTSAPPPLLALRPELPRALAVATHNLLVKNPAQRPNKAAEARAMLARSIVPPPRETETAPATQPFASTIAALNTGTSAVFRAATVFAFVVMLGALLFALSSHMRTPAAEAAPLEGRPAAETRASLRGMPAAVPSKPAKKAATKLTLEEAVRIAESVTRGRVADVRVLRAGGGKLSIATIHNRTPDGTSRLFLLEQHGPFYQVTARAPLDVAEFRSREWTMEAVDLDGDGLDEVLCTGERAPSSQNRRFVLHVPRVHQTYSLRVVPDTGEPNTISATWSPNAMTHTANPYRTALRQRVLATSKTY